MRILMEDSKVTITADEKLAIFKRIMNKQPESQRLCAASRVRGH